MRRLVLIILALATLLPSLAQAHDVLVLQSRRAPAYEELLKTFRIGQSHSQRLIVLSDYDEIDIVRIVREVPPRLIVAIGDSAVAATRAIRTIPVLAVMSLATDGAAAQRPNLTGISMFAPPQSYLALFKEMNLRTVGIIYTSARSGAYLRQAREAARQSGIELVAREVASPHDVTRQLQSLAGKVDALWMLPDSGAITRETSEAFFRFGQDNRVPVISFSGTYLGLGASAVIEIDTPSLGQQAASLAEELLSRTATMIPPVAPPMKISSKKNVTLLRNLNLLFTGDKDR